MRDHLDRRHPHAVQTFVNAGSNVTVTIGRNIGDEPMSRDSWAQFRADVIDHLGALLKPAESFVYHGQGEWEGVTEDSTAILLVATGYTARDTDVERILSVLADTYSQDAIAWSYGPGALVKGSVRELANA